MSSLPTASVGFNTWFVDWFRCSVTVALLPAVILCIICKERSAGQDDRVGSEQFENSIRPILLEHCVSCHGPEKSENGLRLDTRSGLLAGGESGSVVDFESPGNSLILSALRHESLEMPPNKRLPDNVIQEFESWLARKAPWPEYSLLIDVKKETQARLDQGRNYWAFQTLRNDLDLNGATPARWIDERMDVGLRSLGGAAAPLASDVSLFRRIYLDLIGTVPTWEDWERYRNDPSEHRYERLVDSLLADSRYGEHWAQFWLDLVRFAESDGFKQDAFRPSAYLYRDWVIQAFNEDKPYGQFVREQLAGDLQEPVTDGSRIATGFLRHWIYEYNQRDVASQLENILNDLTEVTSEVFLGMSLGCARCHDHKFDPLLQEDYYRLQACFSAMKPCDDQPASLAAEHDWRSMLSSDLDQEIERLKSELMRLESDVRHEVTEQWIEKFPPEIRPALRKPSAERTSREEQIAYLCHLQIENELATIDMSKRLPEEARERWKSCKAQLEELEKRHPKPPPRVMTVTELSNPFELQYPAMKRLQDELKPGVPHVLEHVGREAVAQLACNASDRRLQLARWITDHENPLTWRVIVNRVWQQHFGRGLVPHASDLGALSDPPSHPELLDGLALLFIQHGESLKQLHRWIVTSETYRRSTTVEGRNWDASGGSPWQSFASFSRKRLTAEQLRDSILTIAGELDVRSGGPSDDVGSSRRSIYLKVIRNMPHPLLALFDRPDGNAMVAKRNSTTSPLQALSMINDDWPHSMARKLVERYCANDWPLERCVQEIFQRIYLREPEVWELQAAVKLQREELVDLCHVLFCSNEFLYVE